MTQQQLSVSRRRRRRRIAALRRLRPGRRHLKRALLATAPTAVLIGATGAPPARGPAAYASVMSRQQAPVQLERGQTTPVQPPERAVGDAVEASYYGEDFAGKRTASGERFDPNLLTAAHRTLPFGTLVKVAEPSTGKSVVVRINDRGPFHGNRAIDLSEAAARKIGLAQRGTGQVILNILRA